MTSDTAPLRFDDRPRLRVLCARLWHPVFSLLVIAAVTAVMLVTDLDHERDGLSVRGIRVLAVFAGAIALWVTAALPLVVTALAVFLGLCASGVAASPSVVASWFWRDVVFFLLGAFLIAGSLSSAHVVDHFALRLVDRFGTSPRRLRHLLFVTTFFASFLMSEHAVMALCFPLALRIRDALGRPIGSSTYVRGLFFALAWGATIGGIVTYLGGARNALAMGFLEQAGGQPLGFLELMGHSLPLAVPLAIVAMILIDLAFPCDLADVAAARSALAERRRDLGRFGPRQTAVCLCLGIAVLAWAVTGPAHIAVVALAVSVLLLGSGLVRWKDLAAQVPWDLLLLYGSALALAKALEETGAHRLAAEHVLPLISASPLLAVAVIAALAMFLTEAISNAAVVSVLVPLLLGMSAQIGLPAEHATLAVALPAGLAFMLPMGSPPLAIAFASGEFRLPTMALWGFLLNLLAIPLTVLAARFVW